MADRRDFYLYVDECHNLPSQNLTELLSEARKYRLGLILATQYCSQLGKISASGDDLLAAVFGNVGALITFRTGSQDAEVLAKGFAPYFNSLDIMSLPNFSGYARMNLKSQSMTPFSFRTELNETPENEVLANRIRALSRVKYGRDVRIVEAEVARRVNAWKKDKSAEIHCSEPAPNVVNKIVLELGYLALDTPGRIDTLLERANLATIRDIVMMSDTQLIENHRFTLNNVQKLAACLKKLGCCLQEGGPFARKEPYIDEGKLEMPKPPAPWDGE